MRKIYLSVLLVLILCTSAFALSNEEYYQLRKSSREFSRAERMLTRVWREVEETITEKEFAALQEDQALWVSSGRDVYAKRKMSEGVPQGKAYADTTLERVKFLREKYLGSPVPDSEPDNSDSNETESESE